MLDFIYLIQQKPQLIAMYLSFPLFLWFLFISISASKEYRKQSLVLTIVWGFYCCCFMFKLFDLLNYIEMLKSLILIDIVTGLILVTNKFISRYSGKLALTIAFAVSCHCMILLHKSTGSSEVRMLTVGFYTYYDELIATVGILQLLASYNDGFSSGIKGFTRSLRSSKIRLLWSYSRWVYCIQSCYIFFKQKKSEKRT